MEILYTIKPAILRTVLFTVFHVVEVHFPAPMYVGVALDISILVCRPATDDSFQSMQGLAVHVRHQGVIAALVNDLLAHEFLILAQLPDQVFLRVQSVPSAWRSQPSAPPGCCCSVAGVVSDHRRRHYVRLRYLVFSASRGQTWRRQRASGDRYDVGF